MNLMGEKDKLLTLNEPSRDSPGIVLVRKFRMERIKRIMKDIVKHAQ